MNGIHEVTGSIPVWSTNLRSDLAEVARHSARGAAVGPREERATVGKPSFAHVGQFNPRVADLSQFLHFNSFSTGLRA